MSTLQDNLNNYIDGAIFTNGNGDITADILNSTLKEIVTGLATVEGSSASSDSVGTFTFPNGTLTTNDIGKIVMIGSNDTAELYTYTAASSAVPFEYQLTLSGLATEAEQPPVYGSTYYKISMPLVATEGDSLKVILGEELFTVTISATQDTPTFQVEYDVDKTIFRDNFIEVMNYYDTNIIQAYADENDTSIVNLIATEPMGRVMVLTSDTPGFNSRSVFELENFVSSTNPSVMTVSVNGGDTVTKVTASDWRAGNIPASVDEEVSYIVSYITTNFPNLTATATGNPGEFTVAEVTYEDTDITFENLNYTAEALTEGMPALPSLPTAFPLGKLVSIDGNNMAEIKLSGSIETYDLVAPITLDYSFLNTSNMSTMNLSSQQDWVETLANFLIVPADGGLVKPFDLNDVYNSVDGFNGDAMNHAVLGFAIYSEPASSSVTVVNVPFVNFISRAVRALAIGGIFE